MASEKPQKPTELRLIRAALGYTQARMAQALGMEAGEAQNTLSGWERNPDNSSYPEALEKAKELFLQETGHPWVLPGPDQVIQPIGVPSPESFGSSEVTLADQSIAALLWDELVKGREQFRQKWIEEVAEEIAEARSQGRPPRKQIERLVHWAKSQGPAEST